MPTLAKAQPHIDVHLICQEIVKMCIKRAGSQAALCRELPASTSHISLVKSGKAIMGPELFMKCLEYLEVDADLYEILRARRHGNH